MSPLGQPLNAEIEIVSQPGDEDLVARLASPDAFADAGIFVNPALSGVSFEIVRRNGRHVLQVTTAQPVNEPFLDLLVDLQWNSGRLLREYSVLLDPPEYRSRQQAIAAAPVMPVAPAAPKPAAEPPKPAPVEAKPLPPQEPAAVLAPEPAAPAPEPAAAPAPEPAAAPAAPEPKPAPAAPPAPAAGLTVQVQKGDTLGVIARQHLPPGITLNQMLIAIYRANEDAFIRGNVNLVRAGRILNIPEPDAIGTVDRDEANRLVSEQYEQFTAYRTRLAAVPAPAEQAAAQQATTGRIEPKPEPAAPASQDQVRLSQADPAKPAAPAARAAREDDRVARERQLEEAQSRVADLEKNVADLQKLLEMKNQQLAELEKKAGAQAAAPAPPPAPVPAPAAKAPEKPAAEASKPAAEAPKPAAEAPKPAAEAPKPAAQPAKPPAAAPKPKPKPKPRPVQAPRPQPSLIDEYLGDPVFIGGLGLVVLLLAAYGVWSWRRKKAAHAKFEDSVLGAAAAGAVAGAAGEPAAAAPAASQASVSQAPAGMEAEEVDPIAEADVYIAYGRDSQAEEILKESLQKDASRAAVHAKLLEIYANRKDTKSFEQAALKLKSVTHGAGPEWEKAAALGRSIDPQNGLYGGGGGSAPAAAAPAAAAAAPALDFDLGGASQGSAPAPDISFDEPQKDITASGMDLNLGTPSAPPEHLQTTRLPALDSDQTAGGLDFNLNLGGDATPPAQPAPAAAAAPAAEDPSGGLDFDLKLDDLGVGEAKPPEDKPAAPAMDLSAISLDLDSSTEATALAPAGSADPKWQEVATKLDLAKAYEEMGDKDGARELLNEVVKDGDATQKGQAEQLLAKLG